MDVSVGCTYLILNNLLININSLININYSLFNSLLLWKTFGQLQMIFGLHRNNSFSLTSTLDVFGYNQNYL
jgi:hypothetical protein